VTNVIELNNISLRYNGTPVLKNLSLKVAEGSIYAFLGRNGSGKTTTIKLLLGLLDHSEGTVKVLGLDPVTEGEELMQHVGCVSEDRAMYEWLTADETIRLTSAFYRNWDQALASELCHRLAIKTNRKIAKMSRGERGRLALLLALAHRPRLLILDEPTSGLDSVVRRLFLEETIELIAQEGRTVFFSTHQIEEVERIADHVGILSGGNLVLNTTLEQGKEHFKRVHAYFPAEVEEIQAPDGVFNFRRFDHEILFFTDDYSPAIAEGLEKQGAKKVDVEDMSLDDIFVEITREEEA